jgi:hypothetical protein
MPTPWVEVDGWLQYFLFVCAGLCDTVDTVTQVSIRFVEKEERKQKGD